MFKVKQEHLLSGEGVKCPLPACPARSIDHPRFKTKKDGGASDGTARFAPCASGSVLQLSVSCSRHRKDGNRPGTEVQALGFPLRRGVSREDVYRRWFQAHRCLGRQVRRRSLTYWKRKQNVKRISMLRVARDFRASREVETRGKLKV